VSEDTRIEATSVALAARDISLAADLLNGPWGADEFGSARDRRVSLALHEDAGTTVDVDFQILEVPPIEVYLHTMQPKEVPPPASASAPAASTSLSVPAVPPPAAGDEDVQMSE
jgi:hypothetical protein